MGVHRLEVKQLSGAKDVRVTTWATEVPGQIYPEVENKGIRNWKLQKLPGLKAHDVLQHR